MGIVGPISLGEVARTNKICWGVAWFSPNRPTGPIRSSSRDVCVSVCLFICLSPSNAIFLKCWSQKGSVVECCYLIILIISWERNQHYLLIFSYHNLYINTYLYYVTTSGAVLLQSPRILQPSLNCRAQSCTVTNCTVLHCTSLQCPLLHCTVCPCTALHCTVLHFTAHNCTELHHFTAALHCIALHCTALHCITLQCAALHCTALPWKKLKGATQRLHFDWELKYSVCGIFEIFFLLLFDEHLNTGNVWYVLWLTKTH